MCKRRWWWGLIATVLVVSMAGCIHIKPQTAEGVPVDEPEQSAPAVGSAGSPPGYPGESSPESAGEKPKEAEAPQVTWGPLPVPVYPNSRLIDQTPQRITGGDKPEAYRNFYYTTPDSQARVIAFYRERLGTDIDVRQIGSRTAIFKNLDKGNVLVSIWQASGATNISIQELQKLPPKKHGLFGGG